MRNGREWEKWHPVLFNLSCAVGGGISAVIILCIASWVTS
jgi:hypothetical protein